MQPTKQILLISNPDELASFSVLKPYYNIKQVDTVQACLDFLISNPTPAPDSELFLIIFKQELSNSLALKACHQIKNNSIHKAVRIFFSYQQATEEEQLKAYQAGVDDCIDISSNTASLLAKTRLADNYYSQLKTTQNELNNLLSTAMRSTLQESETGVILECMYDLYQLKNNKEIVSNVLDACHIYALNAIVTLDLDTENEVMMSSHGPVKSIELKVIKTFRDKGNITNIGRRALFVNGPLSILILNMPVNDAVEYKRINEHLIIIGKGVDARLKAIATEEEKNKQQAKLVKLIAVVEELMQALENNQRKHQEEHTQIVNNLMDQIQDSFIALDLTENQENTLSGLIKDAEQRVAYLFDKGADLQQKLISIKMLLQLSSKL